MSKNWLTRKQIEIMKVVCAGMGGDSFTPVDMNALLERLGYKTSRDSMQFSLRRLVMHGLITVGYEWRNQSFNRKHKVISPTKEGLELFNRSV